jgi:glycosyltransferase involved in cell wall biosynthesis
LLIGPVPPPVTGQAIAFSLLVEELKKARLIVTADLSEPLERRDQQFSLARGVQILRLAVSLAGLMPNTKAVYLTIAQSRMGFLRDALFIAIACLWRRPVIAHLHGGNYASYYNSESPAMRFLIRKMLRKVKILIVLSDRLRCDFDFLGTDFQPRLRTVRNASDLPRGQPRKAPNGKLCLLYLSNLVVEKGYMDCVDAMVHLRRLLPDVAVKLILAGTFFLGKDEYRTTAEMEAALREHIRCLELEDTIEVTGTVMGEDKIRLLESANIHLLPTYYRNEGQPITLIEAVSAGVPSVTTRWRDIEDIVAGGEAGIFVPPKNPLAIAEAIADLYNDPDRYERMSNAALDAAKQFSPESYVADISQLIDEVCQPGPV